MAEGRKRLDECSSLLVANDDMEKPRDDEKRNLHLADAPNVQPSLWHEREIARDVKAARFEQKAKRGTGTGR